MSTEEIAKDIAEKRTKQSPVKFILKSSPLRFTAIIPAKPTMQAMTFLAVSFSCLKRRLEKKMAKNEDDPLMIVPFAPEVFASHM